VRSRFLIVAVSVAMLCAPASGAKTHLPARLSDAEFWNLVTRLSEPPGEFRSENFVSNESQFQFVIPGLIAASEPGQVYIGVGPEQNFSYIPATRPGMAFILDIRRGNLVEHLLYKALFEISRDRVDFLSRLFSRKRPPALNGRSTVTELFDAFQRAEPTQDLYEKNVQAVIDRLTRTHHLPLDDEDIRSIRSIYRYGFFTGGPNLSYAAGGGDGGGLAPTYQELMSAADEAGVKRSYLANEQNFVAVRSLQMKNLIVPVVGDFAGPAALRGIGEYARQHGANVTVFYLSNVEDYLVQDDRWNEFCENVRSLPMAHSSILIYSGSGPPDARRRTTGVLETRLRPMTADPERCPADPAGR
jgi:hypothetical protein